MGGGFDWRGLVDDIEALARAGCYERVNKALSLGIVDRLREKAFRLVHREGDRVHADVGAGPGTSAGIIRGIAPDLVLVLVDPSVEMLAISLDRVPGPHTVRLGGIFEALPLADSSVDSITAMFSFRDAIDYYAALDEFARVLRPGGRLAILDFYRNRNPLLHLAVKAYIFLGVPLALLASRCPGYLGTYKSFLRSIDRMLTREELLDALRERFQRAEFHGAAPGVGIFYAEGPVK